MDGAAHRFAELVVTGDLSIVNRRVRPLKGSLGAWTRKHPEIRQRVEPYHGTESAEEVKAYMLNDSVRGETNDR